MYNSYDIAKRIKHIAKLRKIILQEMFETCGMGHSTLSHFTSGTIPRADNLAKIADYLGCSVDYLLGRTDNSEINK